ncbi:hypothetical protein PQI23_13380 [Leucobacter sp. USCH14]|uniref:phage minor capsid protein n=1 Tax=Leucobacter sp. USCH14 TaxID=3024838 RepID=UPI0030B70E1B
MALWEGATPADLLDDLGNAIAQKYRRIELALERKLRRYLEQAIEAPTDLSARLAAVKALREQAARLVATMPPERVAAVVAQIAAGEAATEVARQLLSIPSLAGSTVTSGGLWAVAASQIELTDTLRALNARIHRAPADAYQAMTAAMQPDMLIGRSTWEQVQRRQVDQYLADGITGFIDRSDRRWRIGSYAEMATRTAAARAWRDQSVASMRENGITTFTPVLGSSACGKCAAWAGKVLSDGRVGRVEVPHALTGEATPVHIDATLAEARAAGWGHPNCRCVLIPSLPGLERRDVTTHDPEHERARDTMRALEREVRAARRDNDTEGVEAAQRALRDHTREHGLRRRYWREQLEFSGG